MADIFTDVGEELVVDILDGTSAVPTYHIGQGTGGDTADKTDTTLSTEASETRIVATLSQPSANQSRYVATITADGTKTVTNAGVLTLITGGILYLFSDFAGIPVVINDSIQYTFTVTWA